VSRRSECNRVAEDRWVPFVTTDAIVVIDGPTPGLSATRKQSGARLPRLVMGSPASAYLQGAGNRGGFHAFGAFALRYFAEQGCWIT
jgi:hypothetical protein